MQNSCEWGDNPDADIVGSFHFHRNEQKIDIIQFDFDTFLQNTRDQHTYHQNINDLLILLILWTDDYNPTLHEKSTKYSEFVLQFLKMTIKIHDPFVTVTFFIVFIFIFFCFLFVKKRICAGEFDFFAYLSSDMGRTLLVYHVVSIQRLLA